MAPGKDSSARRAQLEPPDGFRWLAGRLSDAEQSAILADIAEIARQAPFLRPLTPWGKPMTVRMTSAGAVGWVTDRRGYRYEPVHPETGRPWPAIPGALLALWDDVTGGAAAPDSCLINHYGASARMGLHQDKDEADFAVPVLSISLGDDAVFRIGGTSRGGPTRAMTLRSGDVVILGGPARLAYHGVDRIRAGSSHILKDFPELAEARRINLTLRRARAA